MTIADNNGDQPAGVNPTSSGAREQPSESTDPDELRAELARAHDRLSFYEGVDRVMAENVRRSGELMLEMLAMRESVTATADLENRQERDRIGASLSEMDAGLQAIRTQIDTIAGQIGNLRRSLGSEAAQRRDLPSISSLAPTLPSTAAPTPLSPDPGWNAPQVIDVIVHQVSKATVALSLQRYLGNLAPVAGVEAREFAEGVLRMQVTAHQPLTRDDLSGWTDGGSFTVLQVQPHIVELTLGNDA